MLHTVFIILVSRSLVSAKSTTKGLELPPTLTATPSSVSLTASPTMKCFVGVAIGNKNQYVHGAISDCNGECVNTTVTVHNSPATIFLCDPFQVCSAALSQKNTCKHLYQGMSVCCCSSHDSCNIRKNIKVIAATSATPNTNVTRSCFYGIFLEDPNDDFSSSYAAITTRAPNHPIGIYAECSGQCANISLGKFGTVYSCDPLTICESFQIVNRCHQIDNLLSGCCCSTDGCNLRNLSAKVTTTAVTTTPSGVLNNLDMTSTMLWLLATVAVVAHAVPTLPSLPAEAAAYRKCYVGLRITTGKTGAVTTNGAEMACPGACANNTIYLPNYTFDIYTCDSFRLCGLFGGDDQCMSVPNGDSHQDAFRECCCTSKDNCNAIDHVSPIPTLQPHVPKQNETCFTGGAFAGLGGLPIGMPMPCVGDCANYTVNGMTVFACDPVAVCQSFGLGSGTNGCKGTDGLKVCCCNKQDCNIANPPPTNPDLTCFVGLSMSKVYTKGAQMACPSGRCSNITVTANKFPITVHTCDPLGICSGMGIKDDSCLKASENLGGCCCDSDNCNIGDKTKIPPKTGHPPKQAFQCFMGIQMNGGPAYGFNVTHCAGDCARVSLGNMTLYTCDPIATCTDFELVNECRMFNGIKGCCCKGNNCNDVNKVIPMNKPPIITQQRCFVGMTSADFVSGGELDCNGKCANATTTIHGQKVDVFMCDPVGLCKALGIGAGKSACKRFQNDLDIKGCCCEGDANCNIADKSLVSSTASPYVKPIVCHEGFWLGDKPLTAINREVVCHGDCGKVTLNTTISVFKLSATIYTCDPVNMCKSLKMSNSCKRIDGIVDGCCCNSDMCMDPRHGVTVPTPPPPPPYKGLTCYVGLQFAGQNIGTGAEVPCSGACTNITLGAGATTATLFMCDALEVCDMMGHANGCSNSTNSMFHSCCCTGPNSCNAPAISPAPTISPIKPGQNETCFVGASYAKLGGSPIGTSMPCHGDCANYTMGDFTVFMCDPISVCKSLNIQNNCLSLNVTGTKLGGCCCSTKDCNMPTKANDNEGLECFVGLSIGDGNGGYVYHKGARQPCPTGQCSNVSMSAAGIPYHIYTCDPMGLCAAMNVSDGRCNSAPLTPNLHGCCCDKSPFCNVPDISWVPVKNPHVDRHNISCYTGVSAFGVKLGFPVPCHGDCARISMGNWTFYSCDPVDVCHDMGLDNDCSNAAGGLEACCCHEDMCNKHVRIPTRRPPIKMTNKCFVGMGISNGKFLKGDSVTCDGQCANATTQVAGYSVTAYMCDPVSMCFALGIERRCSAFHNDITVQGCCCDDKFNCNYPGPGPLPTAGPATGAIACPEGAWVNEVPLGDPNRLVGCPGDCARVTFNTTINTKTISTSLYMCDPVTLCHQLNMTNKCAGIPNVFEGCCCNEDMCLDPVNNVTYPQHKQTMPKGELMCYVGVQLPGSTIGNGATVLCKGACSNTTINVGSSKFSIYTCDGLRLCGALGIEDTCGNDGDNPFMHGCCCRGSNNCNAPAGLTNMPTMSPEIPDVSHTCFVGASMSLTGAGSPIGMPMPCNGECGNYTIAGFSVYACDPVSVCKSLGVSGTCKHDEKMEICCCNSKDCNLSNKPSVKPDLECYVGLTMGQKHEYTKGAQMACPYGQCANATISLHGTPVTVHTCDPFGLCPALNVSQGSCNNIFGLPNLQGCCCQDNNCNVYDPSLSKPSKGLNRHNITCFEGFSLTGKHRIGFDVQCPGDCAHVHMKNNISLYSCDPVDVCHDFGLSNDCITYGKGLKICCCETDHCNDVGQPDPVIGYPTPPPSNFQCLVGVAVNSKLMGGSMVQCDGMCANVTTRVYNQTVTAYMCDPVSMCETLMGGQVCNDPGFGLFGCCCDNANGCNYPGTNLPAPAAPKYKAIACPEGIWVNYAGTSQSIADPNRIVGCRGDCGSVNFTTTIGGKPFQASLYMCDPADLCTKFNLTNWCLPMEKLGQACCCNSDMCLDPLNGVTVPLPPPTAPSTKDTKGASAVGISLALLLVSLLAVFRN